MTPQTAPAIGKTLKRIQTALGVGDSEFLEMMGLDSRTYGRLLRGQCALSERAAESLCSELDLSLESLYSGRIDLPGLAQRFNHDLMTMPERYSDKRRHMARVRSIRGLTQYVTLLRGQGYVDRLFEKFELRPLHYLPSDALIDLRIGSDLLAELKRDGFTDFQIREMGGMTLLTNRATPLARIFSQMTTGKKLYESMHEEYIHFFDKLWQYKITRLGENRCTIEISTRDEGCEIFESHTPGSREMCIFRQGVYASMIGNIRTNLAQISESQCMYQGASKCVYHLSW